MGGSAGSQGHNTAGTSGHKMTSPPRPREWTLPSGAERRPPPLRKSSSRPAVRGTSCVVSTTHYLATLAGQRIALEGGTAIDAGVAAGIALNVAEPAMCNFGGVAPIMAFRPGMKAPETIDGLGRWPQAINFEDYRAWYGGDIPLGIERSVTPAACDAWLTALARHGTRSLAQVAAPAIELCERGVPVYPSLAMFLSLFEERMKNWPASVETFLPGGRVPKVGEVLKQPHLARLLRRLIDVEARALKSGANRSDAIMAARNEFYLGSIAAEIAAFFKAQRWPLTAADLAGQQVRIETPVSTTYRGYTVYSCGPWCQGPLVPMTLNLLEGYDIGAMGPGSATFLHHYAEAFKLAAADREGFFGDPEFVDVPMGALLSKDYAALRRDLIKPDRAAPKMPLPGDPWAVEGRTGLPGYVPKAAEGIGSPDTAYVCALDAEGNAFSATPSDYLCGSPMVPDLGILISHRGGQSWTAPDHPSALAPGKRPRLTPNPAMLMRDGEVYLAFGSPGEDVQCQAMVQVVCNIVDFGMDIQAAIEAPRAASHSFPGTYHPHPYRPGLLFVESGTADGAPEQLRSLGHSVEVAPPLSDGMGAVCAAGRDGDGLIGGADPRRDSLALAW